jgi:phosphodiesterase/alkaline phosphatase D-like protein
MATPIFQREGCRLGGLTPTTIAAVARTDSSGARLFMDVFHDEALTRLFVSSPQAALNAGNNYQATCYVTGLTANRKYWYRMRADDGAGNSVNGTVAGYTSGSFTTHPATANRLRLAFMSCNPINPSPGQFSTTLSPLMWQRMASLGINHAFNLGDIFYSDIGVNNAVPDYSVGAWRKPAADADATVPAYRTNFITTYSEIQRQGFYNWLAHFSANTPVGYMWDDHDRGWDDMSGSGTWSAAQITRAANGKQAGHEMFMGLNSVHITNDARTWTHNVTDESYYYIDLPGVRILVPDCRTFRSLRTATDNSSKTMLGATQLAWLKDKITNNTQPMLIIASPVMFDGYHGWNESTDDGWVGYTRERDDLIEHIKTFGDPARTVFVTGDTHAGCIAKYHGSNDANTPIYEVAAGNLWPVSAHGFINGFKGGAPYSGHPTYPDGSAFGGEQIVMRVNEPNVCIVDLYGNGDMTVELYELVTGKHIWRRDYSA